MEGPQEEFSDGAGVTVALPVSLLSLSKLEDVLSLDVWNGLDQKEKEDLKQYLPEGDGIYNGEPTQLMPVPTGKLTSNSAATDFVSTFPGADEVAIAALLRGKDHHFGSPLQECLSQMQAGLLHPKAHT